MLVRAKGNRTLAGEEGATPPLPYIEVDDAEGQRLIDLGHAEEAQPMEAEPAPEAPPPPPPPPPPPASEPEPTKVDEDRATLIRDALDLVEADGKGEDGKPTAKAIEEITGLADVTAEEIDAALAAHAA